MTQTLSEQAQKQAAQAKSQFFTLLTDLTQLYNRANKPDQKTYYQNVKIVLLGVLVMGLVGFIVKIGSIPINNILIGGSGRV